MLEGPTREFAEALKAELELIIVVKTLHANTGELTHKFSDQAPTKMGGLLHPLKGEACDGVD